MSAGTIGPLPGLARPCPASYRFLRRIARRNAPPEGKNVGLCRKTAYQPEAEDRDVRGPCSRSNWCSSERGGFPPKPCPTGMRGPVDSSFILPPSSFFSPRPLQRTAKNWSITPCRRNVGNGGRQVLSGVGMNGENQCGPDWTGFHGADALERLGAGGQVLQAAADAGDAHRFRPAGRESAGLLPTIGAGSMPRPTGRPLVTSPEIGLVDVVTPNYMHAPVAQAAIAAGKPCSCEKPIAGSLADAREMAAAAKKAGVKTFVWFNYRRCPAVGFGASTGQRRAVGRNSPRAGQLFAGLGRRSGAAVLAVRQEAGRLRGPRRSQRPHHRHDPLRHRPGNHRGGRGDRRDVRQGADDPGGRRDGRHCGGPPGRRRPRAR